jgi:hypothetical protein
LLVNFVIANGEVRPLMVTQSFPDTPDKLIDGIQFRDGSNDDRKDGGRGELIVWKVSVKYDAQKRPNTWHEATS